MTREANYHPDGGQVFFPVTKEPFVLLLALPGDDIKLEDFVAFYCDGSCGVQIKVQNYKTLVDPKGVPDTCPRPIPFIFVQFSAQISPNNRFLFLTQGLAPPVWEILHPPLQVTNFELKVTQKLSKAL